MSQVFASGGQSIGASASVWLILQIGRPEEVQRLHELVQGLSTITSALGCSTLGCPGGSVVKDPPANAGNPGEIPGSGRSPGGGNGNPLQYSYRENPTDLGAWWAPVHGVTKSGTWLSNSACMPPYSTCVLVQSLIGIFNLLPKRNSSFSHKAESTVFLSS